MKLPASLLFAFAVCSSVHSVAAQGQDGSADHSRPNVILMIADDMNWDDCGAYGNPSIRTPNIDRLAAEGMKFQHAYLTCSSCSPSRSSIITGKYPHNTGAEQLHWPLPDGSETFVRHLQDSGYYTAAAGKWHLGDAIRSDFDMIYEASTAGFVLPSGKDGEPAKMVAAQPSGCEDWEKALNACPAEKPFFLWLAALDPHREYTAGALEPPHRAEQVIVPPHLPDTAEVRGDLALYYDEIGRLDQYVGRVMKSLEDSGRAENTIVLFISDNGRPFPRDKTTLYDGGIRTPLLARWPSHIAAGSSNPALVSTVDLAATILDIAGCDSMKNAADSRSFRSCLTQGRQQHRDFAFAEDHWHDYEDHARAVITQNFKLIRNDYVDLANTPPADAGRSPTWQKMLAFHSEGKLTRDQLGCFTTPRPQWELYDLNRDVGELHNVAGDAAYQSVLTQLSDALKSWSTKTQDYLPSKRTPDEFDRVTGQPDHRVRVRPRKSKAAMFGSNGRY